MAAGVTARHGRWGWSSTARDRGSSSRPWHGTGTGAWGQRRTSPRQNCEQNRFGFKPLSPPCRPRPAPIRPSCTAPSSQVSCGAS